uniref:Uncharacterized protein n=1 Tax=Magallana gigas TaxID=29159 RepID=K1Q521_MAGGI
MHQESNLMDTYLVVTRSKNPSDQRPAIDAALIDLNLNPEIFYEKSANYAVGSLVSVHGQSQFDS